MVLFSFRVSSCFYSSGERAATIDTWSSRGWRRTRAEGAEGRERVAPHILLISVSIVVSVGTPSVRVARPTLERDHPSSCPPFRSRPTLPLSLAKSSPPPVRHRSQPLVYTWTVFFVARIDDASRNRETTIRCDAFAFKRVRATS